MSSKAEYHLLSDVGLSESEEEQRVISRAWIKSQWLVTMFNVVLFSLSCLAMLRAANSIPKHADSSSVIAQTEQLPEVTVEHSWWTDYSIGTETELHAIWDAILPSHGFVAVDEHWAASRHWPESQRLPQDPSKRVYLLEAYHQLHCLTIVRKTFYELSRGQGMENTTWPLGHAAHCFDAIRQHIQCHADNTPLYSFGDNTAGNGQVRRCKSWDALRDFATEHTACYRDSVDPIPLGDHFGHCDQGWDGLKHAKSRIPLGAIVE